jgi:hypothetical protein
MDFVKHRIVKGLKTNLLDNIGKDGGIMQFGSGIGDFGGGGGGAGKGKGNTNESGRFVNGNSASKANGSGGDGINCSLPGINPNWYFGGGGGAGCAIVKYWSILSGNGGKGGGGGGISKDGPSVIVFGSGGNFTYSNEKNSTNYGDASGSIGSSGSLFSGSGAPNSGGGAGANAIKYSTTRIPNIASGGSGIVIISVKTSSILSAS